MPIFTALCASHPTRFNCSSRCPCAHTSKPSSNSFSSPPLIDTVSPSLIRGQINRCCSKRLDHSTRPLRSQYKIRIRSRRELLKTYSAASKMLRFKPCSTSSASEAACLRKSVGAARRPFVNITRSNIDAEGGGVSLTATRANRTAGRRFLTVTALPLAGASSASTHCPVRRSTRRHRYAASASNPSRRAYSAIETPDLCHPLQRASHIALIVPCCSRVNMPSSFSSVQPTCHQESAIYGRASLPNRLRLKCTYP